MNRSGLVGAGIAIGFLAMASISSCSASSGGEPVGATAGAGGSTGGSGGVLDAGKDTAAGGTTGGSGGTSGTGGSVLDSGTNDTGLDPDAACVGITQTAENKLLPADIIFALDNSGSMDAEAKFVQANMNIFSYGIPPHIDPHVVVISADTSDDNGVCIDPPLGSGSGPIGLA